MQWVIGVDEAGRGALAGPVCVGAVLCPVNFQWEGLFATISRREVRLKDSKQLSAQQRNVLFESITTHGVLRHAAAFTDAATIDAIGIVNAAHEAAARAIASLGISPQRARVLLDAGLRAPGKWTQESFVRGDEQIPSIALASIVAKVTRDRHMEALGENNRAYGFENHKGYGTLDHRRAIRKYGLSEIHRVSFECS